MSGRCVKRGFGTALGPPHGTGIRAPVRGRNLDGARARRRAEAPLQGAIMAATDFPTSGLAHVNGIELAYQIHGSGKPLVLLHGGFGSAEMFGPNIAALAAGRQVIGVDLQSHGRTPAVDRPMRFETMADDIDVVLLVLSARERIGAGDRYVARSVFALGVPVLIALNKIDRLKAGHVATQIKTAAKGLSIFPQCSQ